MQGAAGISAVLRSHAIEPLRSPKTPEEFISGRWQDAAASILDPDGLAIHSRVIRWTLDDFEQPPRPLRADIWNGSIAAMQLRAANSRRQVRRSVRLPWARSRSPR